MVRYLERNKNTVSLNFQGGGWLIIYFCLVFGILYSLFYNWTYDDPFITYRYARNLAQGNGFIYNPGEKVLSTTSPLFTLLLTGGYYLWSDIPHLANLIGASSIALGGCILWMLSRLWNLPLVGWACLILYPSFPQLAIAIGSEIPLFLAIGLVSILFFERKNYYLSAIFLALTILTRPDGFLIALLFIGYFYLRKEYPLPWVPILLFLALSLPWLLFSWFYFRSPIPSTLIAKQQQGLMVISQRFAPGFIKLVSLYSNRWVYWFEAVLAILGLTIVISRHRKFLILTAWTVLIFIAYSLLGVTRYPWYYALLVPGFVTATGLGIASLDSFFHTVGRSSPLKSVSRIPSHRILISLLIIALAIGQAQELWRLREHTDTRYPIYRIIGEWIDINTPPSSTIGTLEVGIIGYYSNRYMIDFSGLIQPEVASQLTPQATYEDAAVWAVENYQPNYLVLHAGAFPKLEEDYVQQGCNLIQDFPGTDYDYSRTMNIYVCPGT
jgi:hypothetical protein